MLLLIDTKEMTATVIDGNEVHTFEAETFVAQHSANRGSHTRPGMKEEEFSIDLLNIRRPFGEMFVKNNRMTVKIDRAARFNAILVSVSNSLGGVCGLVSTTYYFRRLR